MAMRPFLEVFLLVGFREETKGKHPPQRAGNCVDPKHLGKAEGGETLGPTSVPTKFGHLQAIQSLSLTDKEMLPGCTQDG